MNPPDLVGESLDGASLLRMGSRRVTDVDVFDWVPVVLPVDAAVPLDPAVALDPPVALDAPPPELAADEFWLAPVEAPPEPPAESESALAIAPPAPKNRPAASTQTPAVMRKGDVGMVRLRPKKNPRRRGFE
ncbi:hypothetical protein [Mycolicibacterium sp. GF69]|uniref:hypothetical protein n=1 Tax=Mycolicibacterium sp. GF69 TaxID=2267251 RepID=UPI0014029D6F|nr:hypothetical protein [Mycolicibacterium sp. GF69]